jgi:N-acetyl-anhydromuramyl-L-alanine amidase AmpD
MSALQPAELPLDKPVPATNYGSRNGAPILLLVVHVMEGSERAGELTFEEGSSHVSAHYGIDKQGGLHRFLPDGVCAWHSGNQMVNRCSLGIELEGHIADKNGLELPMAEQLANFTEPMLAKLAELLRYLCCRYAIPADREHIIGHREVPDRAHPGHFGGAGGHKDPGAYFDWKSLMERVSSKEVTC